MESLLSNIPALVVSILMIICIITYISTNYWAVKMHRKQLAHWEREAKNSDKSIETIVERMTENRASLTQSLNNIDKLMAETAALGKEPGSKSNETSTPPKSPS
ncbi:hypothetical protein HOG98_07535 [bacterium]|jgi:biopolymer transport protein ExbB/TolQ|nr:hypothetical protein [bacterium]